ncbi:carbohydrate ABC transporter permease [Plantactinospora sonchi]|uniref:Sugar ABC transporter permease n=1 Tax=Plantactinospora sonchi TaxID=1544735 RepID=A0ABU7S2X5_9ACTN
MSEPTGTRAVTGVPARGTAVTGGGTAYATVAPGAGSAGPDVAGTTPVTTARTGRGSRHRRRLREYALFLAFVTPNFLLLGVFSYWPVVYNAYLSLTEWDMIAPVKRFVGLDNYVNLFTGGEFPAVLRTTAYFMVGVVGGSLLLGLAVAVLLNQRLRGRGLVRTMVFAPHVLSGAAVGLAWLFIFDPNYGLSRFLFELVGVDSPAWLTDSDRALPAVMVVYLWKNIGFCAIVYLAGLQNLPKYLYESAALDGAGPWRVFRRITLPLLSPVTFFLTVTTIISSFQAFDVIAVMTDGGPGGATTILSWYVYDKGFSDFQAGPAASGAMVMFAILLVVTLLQTRYVERKVHYR